MEFEKGKIFEKLDDDTKNLSLGLDKFDIDKSKEN